MFRLIGVLVVLEMAARVEDQQLHIADAGLPVIACSVGGAGLHLSVKYGADDDGCGFFFRAGLRGLVAGTREEDGQGGGPSEKKFFLHR